VNKGIVPYHDRKKQGLVEWVGRASVHFWVEGCCGNCHNQLE